jgi:hypothetical protein
VTALRKARDKQAPWNRQDSPELRKIREVFQRNGYRADVFQPGAPGIYHLRVINHAFTDKSMADRFALLQAVVKDLPKPLRQTIAWMLAIAPSERDGASNRSFEDAAFSTTTTEGTA